MNTTKTLNPLHFEDLEPHRFEDLVRQLIYDFKEWQSLEATGRSGSDEGFDIRGLEGKQISEEEIQEEGEDKPLVPPNEQRLWLIQCKRQKRISPENIKRCIEEIKTEEKIYGIIFVTACDFSKKTRDAFFLKIRERGILEGHLWGKAELEDMLFQPKNDYLLFAYFGISLALRKRSLKTALNSKLIIKRKLVKLFGDIQNPHWHSVLLRDINDQFYPYKRDVKNFKDKPPWVLRTFTDYYHDGIIILIKEFYAYAKNETQEWDYYEKSFSRGGFIRNDPWEDRVKKEERLKQSGLIHDYWYYRIPEENRAWLRVYSQIPFEKIVAIDEIGDKYTRDYGDACPHLYVVFDPKTGPFNDVIYGIIETSGRFGGNSYEPTEEKRIKYFPDPIPEVTKEEKEERFKKLNEKNI